MAFAWELPNRQRGAVDAPIDRHPFAREKMAVRDSGREAITHWEIQEAFQGRDGKPIAALLTCQLGPQSQAALTALGRQALHAYLLALEHPRTGAVLEWISDLPDDLARLRNALRATQ